MQLPQEYLNNMQNLLGDDYNNYLSAMQREPICGIRVNPLKVSEWELDDVKDALGLGELVPYSTNGYFAASSKVGKHPYHIAGLCYVQEPSSMLPVAASGLQDEQNKDALAVLDLCAAPGGKSGQIAEILAGRGVLVSNEIEYKRAKVLASNIERMGYRNAIITCAATDELAQYLPNTFDYIFVDAPCGGEGMFRKNPDTIAEWSESRLASNAERQLEILAQANTMLKQGGKLIYSTCTFSKTEDEDVVNKFATKFGYTLLQPNQAVVDNTTCLPNTSCCRRVYPQGNIGEGQFVCVLQKRANSDENIAQNYKFNPKRNVFEAYRKDVELAKQFLTANFNIKDDNNAKNYAFVGNNICILSDKLQNILNNLQKITVLAAGVMVGNVEKGRFVPHNNIFLAYGDLAKYKANFALNNPELAAYLHGEQLEKTLNLSQTITHGVVCANGHPLGGVRISNNALKNILPKGLRI